MDFELRVGSARFQVCRPDQRHAQRGRTLGPSEAERVLLLLARASGWSTLRRLRAHVDTMTPLLPADEDALLRWVRRHFGSAGPGQPTWVLRESSAVSDHGSAPASPPTRAQGTQRELARQDLESLQHRGRSYRLVLASEQQHVRGRSGYEAVSTEEARGLVRSIAESNANPAQRALLLEAAELLDTRRAPDDQLVLLERTRSYVAEVKPNVVITAGVLKEAHSAWIELRVVDDKGQPAAHEAYTLELADGRTRSGTLDENGMMYLAGILAGNCQLSFPRLKTKLQA